MNVIRWCGDFAAAVGEPVTSWFAGKRFTFWEIEAPREMAGSTSMVAGMGYGGAVTVEVSRGALAAGARDVVLFTDPANATSNALYRRIGYVPLAEFTGYDFR